MHTEHISLGVSPYDEFATSGQPVPAFGIASKSVAQTFKTPDKKSTELTAFAFYMSRAKPAPRFIVPLVYMRAPWMRATKGPAVFRGSPVQLSAAGNVENAAIVIQTGGVKLKPDATCVVLVDQFGLVGFAFRDRGGGFFVPLTVTTHTHTHTH